MRKSRRVAVAVAVSGLVAAGGITFGLMANANTLAFCNSSASPGTAQAPITCSFPNSTTTDTTINTPSAIQAVVTLNTSDNAATSDQYILITYSVFCSQGGNSATTSNPTVNPPQAISKSATVTETLTLAYTDPDSCTVSNLTAVLEAGASAAAATPVTTGAFTMDLEWTPAASTSTSASATATTSTTHVSTISGYGGKCLDDRGNSSSNRAEVIIWSCNSGDSAQGWTFSSSELKHNGKCANIQGGGGSGSKLILWSCNSSSNEKWFHSSSNGEYVSAETGHGLICVDDPGYSKTNGKQLIVYTCHNSSNQHWSS